MTGRGHIKQRSPGSWTIVLSLGNNPATGKRRRKWETFRGTKRDAEREKTRLLAEYDRGVPPATGKMTVREYLDGWIRDVVTQRNRPRTVLSYASIVRNHLAPALGNILLQQLQPSDVDRMIAAVRGKGLTANTALHVFTVLRKALRDAERRGLVNRNVCRLVDPPKIEPYRVDVPGMDAIASILSEADDTEHGPVLRFMAFTGVRRGEAVALRWKNVDLDRGVVAIVESAQRIPGQGVLSQPTKSSAGRRGIALDPSTVSMLRQHRARQAEGILRLGGVYEDCDLVFPAPTGPLLNPDRLSRAFRIVADRAGAHGVRLHDLRHAHATGMLTVGSNLKVVQERLGHSNAAFTLQEYGHVGSGLQAEAAGAFASALSEASR